MPKIVRLYRSALQLMLCIASVLTMAVGITSCKSNGDAPDVSDIKVSLNTRRLDLDMAKLDTAHLGDGLAALKKKYPDFLDFYLDNLMQFGINGAYSDDAPGVRGHLKQFLTYKDFRGLFDTVARHFPDTKGIDAQLKKGFQYWKHYYPQRSVPKVVYFISGLNNWSAVTVDTDIVAIGLDMYLGADYPYYKSVGIPDYAARLLTPALIPVNTFKSLHQERYPFVMENRNLLDMMVQRGKEQYFLSKIIPFVPDTVRLGFTKKQLDWCEANEPLIYNFFVKANMLYETNWAKIVRYVTDGPEATGMPAESPGNVGTYLGWQIVKAYVAQHPTTTMDQLFALPDAQALMIEAKYKPR